MCPLNANVVAFVPTYNGCYRAASSLAWDARTILTFDSEELRSAD
jgi:hypothetical protein